MPTQTFLYCGFFCTIDWVHRSKQMCVYTRDPLRCVYGNNGTHTQFERKGPLAVMGSMILSEHLERTWPSIHLEGTDFQVKVWNALKEIPRGEVRTYTEIAVQIGHPNSARAVANACAKNPYPPIVPCHRVVEEMEVWVVIAVQEEWKQNVVF